MRAEAAFHARAIARAAASSCSAGSCGQGWSVSASKSASISSSWSRIAAGSSAGRRRIGVEGLRVDPVHRVGEARHEAAEEPERRGRADPLPEQSAAVRSQRPMFSIALAPPQARSSGLQRSASSAPAASAGGISGIGPPAASAATPAKDNATPGGTGSPSAVSRARSAARRP